MSDGWWRIKQAAPNNNGFITTEIPVRLDPNTKNDPKISSPTIPWWIHDDNLDGPCLGLIWEDGREQYFPWANIVHAEYQPPTPD